MKKTITLAEGDLEEHFSRASGPGGQNVNKVATKVTLRHKPSGITVTVQDSRSQSENRQIARVRLLAAIRDKDQATRAAARHSREKQRRRESDRPRGVKRQMVESKRRRARIKQARRQTDD